MKGNQSFWIRCVNLALIGVMLLGYNQVLEVRAAREDSARVTAELETAQLENEQLRDALKEAAKADTLTQESQADADAAETENTEEPEDGGLKDGSYEGTAEGFGGPITVSVEIADGEMTAVEILSADGEDGTFLNMGKEVIDRILSEQSTEVDAVSGATFSSTGIKNAVQAALEQAEAMTS